MSAGAFSAALIFVNAGSPPARFGYAAIKGLRSRYSRCVVAYTALTKSKQSMFRCKRKKGMAQPPARTFRPASALMAWPGTAMQNFMRIPIVVLVGSTMNGQPGMSRSAMNPLRLTAIAFEGVADLDASYAELDL